MLDVHGSRRSGEGCAVYIAFAVMNVCYVSRNVPRALGVQVPAYVRSWAFTASSLRPASGVPTIGRYGSCHESVHSSGYPAGNYRATAGVVFEVSEPGLGVLDPSGRAGRVSGHALNLFFSFFFLFCLYATPPPSLRLLARVAPGRPNHCMKLGPILIPFALSFTEVFEAPTQLTKSLN